MKDSAEEIQVSLKTIRTVAESVGVSEAQLNQAIRRLAEDKQQSTALFQQLCSVRDSVKQLQAQLQPTIFFKVMTPVVSTEANLAPNERG